MKRSRIGIASQKMKSGRYHVCKYNSETGEITEMVRAIKLKTSRVDYRRRRKDYMGKVTHMNWLDFHCDGCDKYAMPKRYPSPKDATPEQRKNKRDWNKRDWERAHHHKVLYAIPHHHMDMDRDGVVRWTAYYPVWYGDPKELRGYTRRKLNEARAAGRKYRAELEAIVKDPRARSEELHRLGLYDFYRWCITQASSYEHECDEYEYDSRLSWSDPGYYSSRHLLHEGENDNENEPIWCPTGWESPGSYFSDYKDEAMYLSNWEGVKEVLQETWPGGVIYCSGEMKILLPRLTKSAFIGEDRWEDGQDNVTEAAQTWGLDGEEPKWLIALKKAKEFHDNYADYPLLFEDDASEREDKAIEEAFGDYEKEEITDALKKAYPQIFEVDEAAGKAFLRRKEELLAQGWGFAPTGMSEDFWGVAVDEDDILDALVLPKELEDYPERIWYYSCSDSGELYFNDDHIKNFFDEAWSSDHWIPPTAEELAENPNKTYGHSAPVPDYMAPVDIMRAWERGANYRQTVGAGQLQMQLEEDKGE